MWKCAMLVSGVPCAMISGTILMPVSCADSWDLATLVRLEVGDATMLTMLLSAIHST